MLKKLAYIFVVLSVFITVGHNIIVHHHHHFETEVVGSRHHDHHNDHNDHDNNNDDEGHNIFSIGQLDENFIFSHYNSTVANNISTTLFLIPFNKLSLGMHFYESPTYFISYRKFPPPDNYFYSTSFRGPPTV